jgi:hypothetical protein
MPRLVIEIKKLEALNETAYQLTDCGTILPPSPWGTVATRLHVEKKTPEEIACIKQKVDTGGFLTVPL